MTLDLSFHFLLSSVLTSAPNICSPSPLNFKLTQVRVPLACGMHDTYSYKSFAANGL